MINKTTFSWLIASDVVNRDGVGMEFFVDGLIVLEIFRNDANKSREVTLYKKEISLSLLEESITKFKEEIPWNFLD